MAFWIKWWPFGKRTPPQAPTPRPSTVFDPSDSWPGASSGAGQPPKQPGILERAGGWVSGTFEQPIKDAKEYARRTGQALANDALAQTRLKVLVSRMQRDLEEHATICREQIATLRMKRFADREVLGISYMRVFTLTDELRRHVISYAEDLQRRDLAQFYIPVPRQPGGGTQATTPPAPVDPTTDPSVAVVLLPEPTEAVALAPPLVFPDPKNMGRGYIKRRGTALADIYQQMLYTMESIQRELHKARRISELEVITLARRLNLLVVQLLQEEVAFGLEMKKGEPAVVVAVDTLLRNLSGR